MDLLGEGIAKAATLLGRHRRASEYIHAADIIVSREIDSTVSLKNSTQLGLTIDPEVCECNLAMVLDRAQELGVGVEVDMYYSCGSVGTCCVCSDSKVAGDSFASSLVVADLGA